MSIYEQVRLDDQPRTTAPSFVSVCISYMFLLYFRIKTQSPIVHHLHNMPRFGHTNDFANLGSLLLQNRQDYRKGLVAVGVFFGLVCATLGLALLVHRWKCGPASGVLDLLELRNQGATRAQRKTRIRRNGRIQKLFLLGSAGITTLSFVLINHGWKPFVESLGTFDEVVGTVAQKANEGVQLLSDIRDIRTTLDRVSVGVQDLCPSLYGNNATIQPQYNDYGLMMYNSSIAGGNAEMSLFDNSTITIKQLERVITVTEYFGSSMESIVSYTWTMQGSLIALNSINLLLFLASAFSMWNVNNRTYQMFALYFLVPAFCLAMVVVVTATCVSSTWAVLNSDACSGGESATLQGTLVEILLKMGAEDMLSKSVEYYSTECSGTNPMGVFFYTFGLVVWQKRMDLQAIQLSFHSYNPSDVSNACGSNASIISSTFDEIDAALSILDATLGKASNLTSCDSFLPTFHGIFDGPLCRESPKSLGVLFGAISGIAICGFVMLFTRAALYNPIVVPRRKKRREREFREYKDYMKEFYGDTGEWKSDPEKKPQVHLQSAPTFESEYSSTSTVSSETDAAKITETSYRDKNSPKSRIVLIDHSCLRPDAVTRALTSRVDESKITYKVNDEQNLTPERVGSNLPEAAPAAAHSDNHATQRSRFIQSVGRRLGAFPVPNYDDPGVEYYSSDSDDESIVSTANISVLVSRFFTTNRATNDKSSVSNDSSVISSRFKGIGNLLAAPKCIATPAVEALGARSVSSKACSAPFDEPSFAQSSDECESLPPPQETIGPLRPVKQFKSLLRTKGAAKY
jgi:hypothetical protein